MAVGPGGINYMPQNRPQRAAGNLAGYGGLTSPFATQIQQLASQLGGGNPAQNIQHVPGYAQMTGNPQLWIQRHPAAMAAGHVPDWISNDLAQQAGGNIQNEMPGAATNVPVDVANGFRAPGAGDPRQAGGGQMNPHQVLNDIVAHHRASNGLPAMHPEELHGRVTALAHEILHGRNNRLQKMIRGIRPPVAPQQAPVGPVGGPFQAQ